MNFNFNYPLNKNELKSQFFDNSLKTTHTNRNMTKSNSINTLNALTEKEDQAYLHNIKFRFMLLD